MGATGVRNYRLRDRGERLTEAERRTLIALHPSRSRAAALVGVSPETLAELLSPYGQVRASVMARLRERMGTL